MGKFTCKRACALIDGGGVSLKRLTPAKSQPSWTGALREVGLCAGDVPLAIGLR